MSPRGHECLLKVPGRHAFHVIFGVPVHGLADPVDGHGERLADARLPLQFVLAAASKPVNGVPAGMPTKSGVPSSEVGPLGILAADMFTDVGFPSMGSPLHCTVVPTRHSWSNTQASRSETMPSLAPVEAVPGRDLSDQDGVELSFVRVDPSRSITN